MDKAKEIINNATGKAEGNPPHFQEGNALKTQFSGK